MKKAFQAVASQAGPSAFCSRRIFCRATKKDHTLPISRCEPSHSVPASPAPLYISSAYCCEILICAENPQALDEIGPEPPDAEHGQPLEFLPVSHPGSE